MAARVLAVALPEAVATAVIEFITGDLLRGSYRVLYEIDDSAVQGDHAVGEVRVLSFEHRRDAYRHRWGCLLFDTKYFV